MLDLLKTDVVYGIHNKSRWSSEKVESVELIRWRFNGCVQGSQWWLYR